MILVLFVCLLCTHDSTSGIRLNNVISALFVCLFVYAFNWRIKQFWIRSSGQRRSYFILSVSFRRQMQWVCFHARVQLYQCSLLAGLFTRNSNCNIVQAEMCHTSGNTILTLLLTGLHAPSYTSPKKKKKLLQNFTQDSGSSNICLWKSDMHVCAPLIPHFSSISLSARNLLKNVPTSHIRCISQSIASTLLHRAIVFQNFSSE